MRATPLVLRALEAGRLPISYASLVDRLTPAAVLPGRDRVEDFLDRLWREHVFLTDLTPAPAASDPLGHVIHKLQPIPEARTVCLRLSALQGAIERCEAAPPDKAIELHRYAAAQAKLIVNVGPDPPLQTDCSVSLVGKQIRREVSHHVARAAEVLLRLGGSPYGPPRVVQYRQAFLARYGRYREVALYELISPDWGLGPLSATTPTHGGPTAEGQARRARAVQELAMDAVRDRKLRVVIDEAMFARLEHKVFDPQRAPLSIDLHISVIADQASSIDRGRFSIALAPTLGVIGAGRYASRFANVLGCELDGLRRALADREQALCSERLVDLSYLPTEARAANVGMSPIVRSHHSVFGAFSDVVDAAPIDLDEIMVSVHDDCFKLRWSRGKCFVRFCAGHVMNINRAPQVVQFLLEASQDGVAQLAPFDWGACATYPLLPRLEYQRIILCPARWRVDAPAHLRNPGQDEVRHYISSWRAHWDVPRRVYLSAGDNRLLLDLDDPEHLREFALEVGKLKPNGACYVEEALPGVDHAWVQSRDGSFITEIVVPLIKRSSGAAKAIDCAREPGALRREQRLKAPGGDWIYLKLYVPRGLQDDVLRGPVLDLCEAVAQDGEIDKWFFVRYADPDPHLRLRFHGTKEHLDQEWRSALLDWANRLLERGVCDRYGVDTYEREIERYGGLSSTEIAESLFHLDSLSVLQLLEHVASTGRGLDMAALAVATLDDFYDALAPDPATAALWLSKAAGQARKTSGEAYREKKPALLAFVGERCAARPRLKGILQNRRRELGRVVRKLRALDESAGLCVSMEDLCRSLAHMHLNRLFPIGQYDEERLIGLLARTRQSLAHSGSIASAGTTVHAC